MEHEHADQEQRNNENREQVETSQKPSSKSVPKLGSTNPKKAVHLLQNPDIYRPQNAGRLQSAINSVQKSYGNRFTQKLVSQHRPAPSASQRPSSTLQRMIQKQKNSALPISKQGGKADLQTVYRDLSDFLPPTMNRDLPPDMVEFNYGQLTPLIEGGDGNFPQVSIGIPSAPPRYVPPPSDPWAALNQPQNHHPSHHQQRERDPFEGMRERSLWLDRINCWEAFQNAAAAVQGSLNQAAPHLRTFYVTTEERAEELQEIHEFAGPSGGGVSVAQLANQQAAGNSDSQGRTRPNSISVGDLFGDQPQMPGFGSFPAFTELDLGRGGQEALDRMQGRFVVEYRAVEQADQALEGANNEALAAASGIEEAKSNVDAKMLAYKRAVAQSEVDEERERVGEIEAQINSAKEVGSFLVSAVTAIGTTAAGDPDVGSITASAEFVANRIVDAAYNERLTNAKRRYREAVERVTTLVENEAAADVSTALHGLDRAQGEYEAKKSAVREALVARKTAFERYANLIAREARRRGASPDAANRIRGAISAIPIVETVVSAIEGVKNVAVAPPYNRQAGMGLGMARYHDYNSAWDFIYYYRLLSGYQGTFEYESSLWNARLSALRNVTQSVGRMPTTDGP